MSQGTDRRPAGRISIAALALACAFGAPQAAAMSSRGDGSLSPRLAELAKPSVGRLPPAKQARALSVAAEGPGSLLREGSRVLVDVRFDRGAAAGVEALRAAGAKVVNVSRRYQTVTVASKPAGLRAVARVARVAGVTEDLAPILSAACPSGDVVSEGDSQLRAAEARSGFGLDGSGVTVGILSDSFDQATSDASGKGPIATHAPGDVASGDLPGPGNPCGESTPVNVLENLSGSAEEEPADEGRGMAQIVHDLAPRASLAFASAFNGELSFARNIERLAKPVSEGGAGAKAIADDVAYLDEPFFQDGPVAAAINRVAAAGVDYFTAAGNDNLIEEPEPGVKNDIASWEAPAFRDSEACPASLVVLSEEVKEEEEELGIEPPNLGLNAQHCMDFNPGSGTGANNPDETFGITVPEEGELALDLQWAEPWGGVSTDIDVYLLDEAGDVVEVEPTPGESFPVGSAEDNVNRSQEPFEFFEWENTGPEQEVQVVINRYSGGNPRLKFALLDARKPPTATEYPESEGGDTVGPTIFGHSGAASAESVGAIKYNAASAPEKYSSRGPVIHYFGPVTGTTPAAPLGPQTISKPDVVATDCGATTFFAQLVGGTWRFCGTSAAAPHAAAVAALMLQANSSLSPAQVRGALATSATPVGSFGPDAVGAGLVNAFGAVESVAPPPTITITKPPAAISRNRTPTIEFTANRPVTFSCEIDGGLPQACSSPFTVPSPLADGPHGIAVSGTDIVGKVGTSAASFTVDTRRPRTFFRRHPRHRIRTRHRRARATFRFGSNESDVTFVCKVDRGLLHFCGAKLSRRFHVGRHVVRVKARDAAGNIDRTPAVFRFRVKHVGRR
jgi:Subtilase family